MICADSCKGVWPRMVLTFPSYRFPHWLYRIRGRSKKQLSFSCTEVSSLPSLAGFTEFLLNHVGCPCVWATHWETVGQSPVEDRALSNSYKEAENTSGPEQMAATSVAFTGSFVVPRQKMFGGLQALAGVLSVPLFVFGLIQRDRIISVVVLSSFCAVNHTLGRMSEICSLIYGWLELRGKCDDILTGRTLQLNSAQRGSLVSGFLIDNLKLS